jgi:uncharacterized membrane protein
MVPVKLVSIEQTTNWLARGWADFVDTPGLSLLFGGVYPAFGLILIAVLESQGLGSLIFLAATAFMLVGPLAAVCLYEVSRRRETGEPLGVLPVIRSVAAKLNPIGDMGLVLMVIMLCWFLIGFVLFALFFSGSPPSLERFVQDMVFEPQGLPFLLLGTIIGGVLATIVFTISVFAMPMILDKDVTAFDAMTYSIQAVWKNRLNMVGWAATIAAVTFFGIALAFVGLLVSFPVVAYASWHAYRDVAC